MRTRAVIFDFNGTISDDEPILDRLFREVFAADGIEFDSGYYFDRLAGLSDPEIVERALTDHGETHDEARAERLLRAKVDRYKQLVGDEPTVLPEVAAFVRAVAAKVPIAIASGALREEVEHVLEIAGLRHLFAAIVCIDDVEHGKPAPDGYVLALERLNEEVGDELRVEDPANVLVFEDADVGVAAAHAAGMRCVAIDNPAYHGERATADRVVKALCAVHVDELLA